MRLFTLLLALLPSLTFAAGGGVPLTPANVDLSDTASLQNGAKLFVNYCMGCHSANFMRFNRLGKDLGISDEQLRANLMFSTEKVGDPMHTVMDKDAAKAFFGIVPPDLSVSARARGSDWLYTYLMSFYVDEKKAVGVNNLVFPDVGMPHVLWELQGLHKLNHDTHELEAVDKGKLSAAELKAREESYRKTVRDLVNFMTYMGEPIKLYRQELGVKVLIFLFIFFLVSYWMKREFWRDVT